MKQFDTKEMPENLQALIKEIPYIMDSVDFEGGAEYKVQTAPDPEWGNMHVPISQWLIKNGANKGEKVYLKNIDDPI